MVGRSNVGKSSLINAVVNRKAVARVSQTPGKTQAVQFYLINERFYLVDLPGYGYAKVAKSVMAAWGELVRGYLDSSESLKQIFLLLDIRRKPGEHDLQMHEWAQSIGIDASECIYVGDDERDIIAARAAGMPSVVALWGYRLHEDDPFAWQGDVLVHAPSELCEAGAWPRVGK